MSAPARLVSDPRGANEPPHRVAARARGYSLRAASTVVQMPSAGSPAAREHRCSPGPCVDSLSARRDCEDRHGAMGQLQELELEQAVEWTAGVTGAVYASCEDAGAVAVVRLSLAKMDDHLPLALVWVDEVLPLTLPRVVGPARHYHRCRPRYHYLRLAQQCR